MTRWSIAAAVAVGSVLTLGVALAWALCRAAADADRRAARQREADR